MRLYVIVFTSLLVTLWLSCTNIEELFSLMVAEPLCCNAINVEIRQKNTGLIGFICYNSHELLQFFVVFVTLAIPLGFLFQVALKGIIEVNTGLVSEANEDKEDIG